MGQLHRALHLIALPCSESTRLLSEAMERPLSRSERFAVRLHTLFCGACRQFRRQIALMHELLRQSVASEDELAPSPASSLSPQARERIKQALREP